MKIKPSDVLQACADVFLKKGTHCKYKFAKAGNRSVSVESTLANKWCSIGAIQAAVHVLAPNNAMLEGKARMYLANAAECGDSIATWNDRYSTTQRDVQAAFQKAADLARKDKQ